MTKDPQQFFESILDRSDGKWSHPEIESFYEAMKTTMDTSAVLNPDLPYAERKKTADIMRQVVFDRLPPMTPEAEILHIPGCPEEPDAPEVTAYLVRPKNNKKKNSCVFVIPGGGFYIDAVRMLPLTDLAERWNSIIVTLDYRHLYWYDEGTYYPKAVNDCHAVYAYLIEHARELGISKDKMVLEGLSTGGHLSLVLAHRLKRYNWCGAPMPRGVIVDIPVTDCRTDTWSINFSGAGWTGKSAVDCGRVWLEDKGVNVDYPAEAFANFASEEDCIGLPPTFIHTGDCDPAVGPNFEYASKLIKAGVFCEVHCWGGENHAALTNSFDTNISERFNSILDAEVNDCINYDLRRLWLYED